MDSILLMIRIKSETLVHRVVENKLCFEDLIRLILSKFPLITRCSLELKYTLGSYQKCWLSNDEDCSNMLIIAQTLAVKFICIDVEENESGLNSNSGSIPAQESGGANNLQSGATNNCESSRISPRGAKRKTGGASEIGGSSSTISGSKTKVSESSSLFQSSSSDDSDSDHLPAYDICPNVVQKDLLTSNWSKCIIGIGQCFKGGMEELRRELIKYSFKLGFEFVYLTNNNDRLSVECGNKFGNGGGCVWFLKASHSNVDNTVSIYKCDLNHTCQVCEVDRADFSKRVGCFVISDLILQTVRSNPSYSPKDVINDMMNYYGITVLYSKAWRSIEKARNKIFGDYEDSFQELQWYVKALHLANPGSVAIIEADPNTKCFSRLFVSFRACIDGFKFCRPILFVDGTFMKSRFKGTLLSATAKDGNQGLYPFAFSVVSAENTENWHWFLLKIREIIGNRDVSFVSDRNVGLLEAFPQVFDSSRHYYCLVHLFRNLKEIYSGRSASSVFRKKMCFMLKECAYAPNIPIFNQKLALFKREGGKAACDFLCNLPYEKWAIAHSERKRYAELTSNAAESFNMWIKEARSLPITHMVDCIRSKIMKWFVDRSSKGLQSTRMLCPKIDKKWSEFIKVGSGWQVRLVRSSVYEVLSDPSVVVDLDMRTCSCYQWQIQGFPCCHAAILIVRCGKNIVEMVDAYFLTSNYVRCYEGTIMPIPTTERFSMQPEVGEQTILPPVTNRLAGRPKKKRIASRGESTSKRKMTCSRCKRLCNHNARTCRESMHP